MWSPWRIAVGSHGDLHTGIGKFLQILSQDGECRLNLRPVGGCSLRSSQFLVRNAAFQPAQVLHHSAIRQIRYLNKVWILFDESHGLVIEFLVANGMRETINAG